MTCSGFRNLEEFLCVTNMLSQHPLHHCSSLLVHFLINAEILVRLLDFNPLTSVLSERAHEIVESSSVAMSVLSCSL